MKKLIVKNNLCVILLTLICFVSNGYVTSAQNKDQISILTDAERKEADEIATEFTLSFVKNKSIESNISLYYSQDFFQRYAAQVKKEAEDEVWMIPFLIYKPGLLLETKELQLKEFYTVSHNFFLTQTLFILRKIENDKNADIDKAVDELFSSKLRTLLENNPNTNGLSVLRGTDSGKSKPISSLEELSNAINTLSEAVKIMNESDQSVISETKIREICKSLQSEGLSKTRAEITDEEYYKLPKGTKVISVVSPLMINLDLVKIDGKLKVIATQFYAE